MNAKIYVILSKNQYILGKLRFYWIFLGKKGIFSWDFDIFDGIIGCATKFYVYEICFFFFLKSHSTEYTAIELVDRITHALDKKKNTI